MDGTTILRILNLAIWAALFVYMTPGAASAIWGKTARRGDPMRLGVLSVCVIFIFGMLRGLTVPDRDTALNIILVLSLGVGSFIFWLGRSYGRGPRV